MDNTEIRQQASEISYQQIFNPPLFVPRMFPGHDRQPCAVRYTMLRIKRESISIPHIAIVVIQTDKLPSTFYTNAGDGRDALVNAILKEAVPGVRLEFVHMVFISEHHDGIGAADELPLRVTAEAIMVSSVPHTISKEPVNEGLIELVMPSGRTVSWKSFDEVAGAVEVYTDYDQGRRPLSGTEVESIYNAMGLPFPGMINDKREPFMVVMDEYAAYPPEGKKGENS